MAAWLKATQVAWPHSAKSQQQMLWGWHSVHPSCQLLSACRQVHCLRLAEHASAQQVAHRGKDMADEQYIELTCPAVGTWQHLRAANHCFSQGQMHPRASPLQRESCRCGADMQARHSARTHGLHKSETCSTSEGAHLILQLPLLSCIVEPLRLRAPGQRQPVLYCHLNGQQHRASQHLPQHGKRSLAAVPDAPLPTLQQRSIWHLVKLHMCKRSTATAAAEAVQLWQTSDCHSCRTSGTKSQSKAAVPFSLRCSAMWRVKAGHADASGRPEAADQFSQTPEEQANPC